MATAVSTAVTPAKMESREENPIPFELEASIQKRYLPAL